MSNNYFNWPNPISDFTRIRAQQVNDLGSAVAAGFDLLPSPTALAGGLQNYAVSTGADGDFLIAPAPPVTSLIDGIKIQFKAGHGNIGPARLKVSDLPYAQLLDRGGAALVTGDILQGYFYEARYTGGVWRLQTQVGPYQELPDVVAQTSTADTTQGRALLVGGLGYGGDAVAYPGGVTDMNLMILPGRWAISTVVGLTNYPILQTGFVEVIRRAANRVAQVYYVSAASASGRKFFRSQQDIGFSGWAEDYTQGSVLGTVSQAGGVPTGALFESGTHANGRWWKFASGLMIARKVAFTVSAKAIATAHMGGFRSTIETWTYPAAFADVPSVVSTASLASAFGCFTGTPSETDCSVYWTAITSQSAADRSADIVAVGRWFV